MQISLKDIAKLVNGKIIGNSELSISSLAKIDEAKSGELTFLYLPAYEKFFILNQISKLTIAEISVIINISMW